MAKIVVDRPGVPPIVGQLVAAPVTQHRLLMLKAKSRNGTTAVTNRLLRSAARGRLPQRWTWEALVSWPIWGLSHVDSTPAVPVLYFPPCPR